MNLRLRNLLLAVVTALSLGACSGESKSAAKSADEPVEATAAPNPVAPASLDPNDPCRLLAAAEVEAALGATLAGPPYRVQARASGGDGKEGVPNAKGDTCRYALVGGRNLEVGFQREGGPMVLRFLGGVQKMTDDLAGQLGAAKGTVRFAGGSTLRGDWDEARVSGCCTFYALLGDGLVTLDALGYGSVLPAVGRLADLALPRLAAPLAVDGVAGNAAAAARLAARPAPPADPCSLTSADRAAAIWGAASRPPVRRRDACVLTVPFGGGEQEIEYTVRWRDGFADFYGAVGSAKSVIAGVGGSAATAKLRSLHSEAPTDVGDAAFLGPAGFYAVKDDVLIELQKVQIHDPEKAKAFMRSLIAALPR